MILSKYIFIVLILEFSFLLYLRCTNCEIINSTTEGHRKLCRTSSVILAKAALRREIGMKLDLLSPKEKIKQSKIVANKLFILNQFQIAKHVCVYLSIENEIDTEPIVRRIFEDGKRCFVPRYKKHIMEMVELYSMKDWATLPVTTWNIKQPSFEDNRTNCFETGLDLVITPGVAFTKSGDRLGHGGGYYDKFLNEISDHQVPPPTIVSLGFKEQIVKQMPTEDTDFPVDLVLYP